jgi:hypothetical protein
LAFLLNGRECFFGNGGIEDAVPTFFLKGIIFMDEQSGIYSEVIALTVNTEAFGADLSKLENMWAVSLDKMSEKARTSGIQPGQIISPDALASLEKSLAGLGGRVDSLTSSMTSDFSKLSSSITEELSHIDSAVSKTEEHIDRLNDSGTSMSKRGGRRSTMLGVDKEASLSDNFISGLTMGGQGVEGLAAMTGFMVSMSTIGTALFAVITGVKEAFMAIPNAIKSGITYLEEMEQKGAELTPVIQRAAGFGNGDVTAGMAQSGKVASQVLDELRTKAAALHLNFDQLLFTFKDLAANGGAGMVNNFQELVEVAVRLNEAVKMTVPDMQQQRTIMRELPQLMNGTASESSKLLEALGLSKQQAHDLVVEASQHKDLLAQIVPLTQEWSEANKSLPATYTDLKASLSLMLDKLEATLAAPLFGQLKAWAEDFMGWLDKHRDALSEMGDKLGTLVQRIAELGTALVEAAAAGFGGGHSIKELFDGLLTAAIRTVTAVSGLSTIIGDVFDLAYGRAENQADKMKKLLDDVAHYKGEMDDAGGKKADDSNILSDKLDVSSKGLPAAAFADQFKELGKSIADVKSKAEDFRASLQGTGEDAVTVARKTAESYATEKKTIAAKLDDFKQNGLNGASQDAWAEMINKTLDMADADNASVDKGAAGARRALNKALIDHMKEDVSKGLNAIKESYGKSLDDQKQMETEQTESAATGTKNRIALRQAEQDAYQQILADATKKYGGVPGASTALNVIKETIGKLKAEGDKQDTADRGEDFKTTRSIEQDKFKTQEQLAEVHYHTMSELFRAFAQEGYLTYKQAANDEIEAQKELYAQKRTLAIANFNSAHPKGADPNSADAIKFNNSLGVMDAAEQAQRSQDSQTVNRASLHDSSELRSKQTAAISAQIAYTQTVTDGAAKQKQLNDLLAKRLKADNDYLLAVEKNPDHTTDEVRSAMSHVNQDKLAQTEQFNATHIRQETATSDDQGNDTGNNTDVLGTLEKSADKVSQVFQLLEQTTNRLIQAHGNLAEKIGAGAGGASGAIGQISGAFGGAMKDAGGMLGSIGSALPAIGAAVGVAGQLFSMIGGMFTQQAKNIAEQVQKAFNKIMADYSNNTASFTETMASLQAEQANAIQQLSGKKGGAGYLSQIELQIKETEDALRAQALAGRDQMGILTAAISQSTKVAQNWLTTWSQIEQQVKTYLEKDGGNTALAAQYQNAELADQARQIQDQINSGMQTAIQDNYTLNGLLMSRQQLQLSILQLQEQQSDSIERRQAPAMSLAAQQSRLQLQELKTQLSDVNSQISIEQNKVTAENQLFGLSTDINALHAADAKLQAAALAEQLANYAEMLKIIQQIAGLKANPNTGYFPGTSPFNPAQLPGGLPGFGATSGPTAPSAHPIVINGDIHVSLPGMKSSSDVARGIGAELQNWRRFGVSL